MSKTLSLHPQSSLRIHTEVLGFDGNRTACAGFSKQLLCGCRTDFVNSAAGVAESECFSIGMASVDYSVNFFVAGTQIASQSFDILPGHLEILNFVRQPGGFLPGEKTGGFSKVFSWF